MLPKVFLIGYNKTATCAFHEFFLNNHYNSIHWKNNMDFLAKRMKSNYIMNLPMLHGIDYYDFYSDFSYCENNEYIEGNEYFQELDEDYPNSYFIMQYRPLDDWINSRLNHIKNGKKDYPIRIARSLDLPNINMVLDLWEEQWNITHKEMIQYFNGYDRFLPINIAEEGIETIIHFLRKDYELDKKYFKKVNITNEKSIK